MRLCHLNHPPRSLLGTTRCQPASPCSLRVPWTEPKWSILPCDRTHLAVAALLPGGMCLECAPEPGSQAHSPGLGLKDSYTQGLLTVPCLDAVKQLKLGTFKLRSLEHRAQAQRGL